MPTPLPVHTVTEMRRELGYLAESDLDLMLVLDVQLRGPLCRLLLERVGAPSDVEIKACRSTIHAAGTRETDVLLTWDGGRVLVEDKVDAGFTPCQPGAYRAEVLQRRQNGESAWAVLVCPERLRSYYEPKAAGAFDAIVTCKELAEAAEAAAAAGDRLGHAAACVFRAAEEPKLAGRELDPQLSAWGDQYRDLIAEIVHADERLDPGSQSLRVVGAESMFFACAGVDPPEVWALSHHVPSGVVRMELMVPGTPHDVPAGATLVRKAVMWWVEVRVPPMAFDRPPSEQREAVERAAHAALALRRWAADRPWPE